MNSTEFHDLEHYKTPKGRFKDAIYEALAPFTINQDHTNKLGATMRRVLLNQDADINRENVAEVLGIIEENGQAIIDILATKTCIQNETNPAGQASHSLDQIESLLLALIEKSGSSDEIIDEKELNSEENIDKTKRQEFCRLGAGAIHISPITGGFMIQEFEHPILDGHEEPLHEYTCYNYTIDND